jgi:predicted HTH domain antitoxin
MNKISAQEIRKLEIRIARLEKESKILDWLKSIPINLLSKIQDSFGEISSLLKLTLKKNKESILEGLVKFLEVRVSSALDKSLMSGYPIRFYITNFDPNNPMNSEAQLMVKEVGGELKSYEATVRDMPAMLKDVEGLPPGIDKDIKGAYISWWKDFEEELKMLREGRMSRSTDLKSFWNRIKGASKFLYRFLRVIYSFKWAYEVFSLVVMFTSLMPLAEAAPERGKTLTYLGVGKMILNIFEKVLRRRKVNMDLFDELAAKKASSHPYPYCNSLVSHYERICK